MYLFFVTGERILDGTETRSFVKIKVTAKAVALQVVVNRTVRQQKNNNMHQQLRMQTGDYQSDTCIAAIRPLSSL